MDSDFSISKPEEQKALLEFCHEMKDQEGNFIVKGTTDCWFTDFKLHLDAKNIAFPIADPENFNFEL
jgi:hypothetical protein